jgi:hypothetical protein
MDCFMWGNCYVTEAKVDKQATAVDRPLITYRYLVASLFRLGSGLLAERYRISIL